MAIGLVGGALLAGPLAQMISARTGSEGDTAVTNPFAAWSGGMGGQDLLILGTDVGGGNTDVIATLHIEGDRTEITQIPRDTYIEAESFGPVKINALYSLGGTDAVKREVSQRLGRPIQHHLVVNLSAIRQMADMLGGIEVDVPKRMFYVDRSQGLSIDLQPGVQTLRGKDLEGFLRFRHDETGDLGRMDRQQLALKSLFRKLTRPEYLVRLPALMMAARKEIRTDLGPMELGGLITAMGRTQLNTQRLDGRPFYKDGISYWDATWPSPSGQPLEAENSEDRLVNGDRHRFLF
ncbi:LCP family protein [Synechococcus sp. CCY 9618]|uniref:LCP family protein n=1 Tax=Synechococcus sp. CCY 9618 TaxID=2815602 RepID=UPI001C23BE12|nr:LCP family protein [Synechococcus sp. CCY 9618]